MLAIGDLIRSYQKEVRQAFGIELFSHHCLVVHSHGFPGNTGEFGNSCLIHLGGSPDQELLRVTCKT